MTMPEHKLTLAHSPDPDDAFMWWPLIDLDGTGPAIDTGAYEFTTVTEDIETLNKRSETDAPYDITAISCAQYARVRDRYAITSCGASVGDGYGPRVVAKKSTTLDVLRTSTPMIASPGSRTTAFTAFSLLMNDAPFDYIDVPFKEVPDVVAAGDADAGIVIHEGQLTFEEQGLSLIVDLGAWWKQTYQTLLPLGLNVIDRSLSDRLGSGGLQDVTSLLQQSIEHAMANREASVEYALGFARDMEASLAGTFIDLYVNKWTLAFGDDGEAAVTTFLDEAARAGLLPTATPAVFIEPRTTIV